MSPFTLSLCGPLLGSPLSISYSLLNLLLRVATQNLANLPLQFISRIIKGANYLQILHPWWRDNSSLLQFLCSNCKCSSVVCWFHVAGSVWTNNRHHFVNSMSQRNNLHIHTYNPQHMSSAPRVPRYRFGTGSSSTYERVSHHENLISK